MGAFDDRWIELPGYFGSFILTVVLRKPSIALGVCKFCLSNAISGYHRGRGVGYIIQIDKEVNRCKNTVKLYVW